MPLDGCEWDYGFISRLLEVQGTWTVTTYRHNLICERAVLYPLKVDRYDWHRCNWLCQVWTARVAGSTRLQRKYDALTC